MVVCCCISVMFYPGDCTLLLTFITLTFSFLCISVMFYPGDCTLLLTFITLTVSFLCISVMFYPGDCTLLLTFITLYGCLLLYITNVLSWRLYIITHVYYFIWLFVVDYYIKLYYIPLECFLCLLNKH